MVSASSSAITRGWPNFSPGAFLPSSVTAGCTTRWMLSPLKPLLWLTRFTSSKRRLSKTRTTLRDLPPDLLQVLQIGQAFVHSKVVRVAESSFRPAAAPFFEVLPQIEVLIVDVQTWMHIVLDHAGPKLAGRLLRHHTIEDQLHPVRPPQIQVVANNFFEKLTPTQGTVEDLRQADFHLPDRQVPVVTRLPVLRPQGKR